MEKKPEHRPRTTPRWSASKVLEEIEQRELARVGRGEEVAKAKLIDNVETAPIDESGQGSRQDHPGRLARRKRFERSRRPFYRQGWFVVLSARWFCLVSLAGLTWKLLVRPDKSRRHDCGHQIDRQSLKFRRKPPNDTSMCTVTAPTQISPKERNG